MVWIKGDYITQKNTTCELCVYLLGYVAANRVCCWMNGPPNINGLVNEICNSIANALELHISCTNPSIWDCWNQLTICCKHRQMFNVTGLFCDGAKPLHEPLLTYHQQDHLALISGIFTWMIKISITNFVFEIHTFEIMAISPIILIKSL